MQMVSDCEAGQRGVLTGNEVIFGTVRRGAKAEAVIAAPEGTRFVSVRWSGRARRVDCRYALQIWAEVPNAAPLPIVNVRPNEGCPKRGRAQGKSVSGREVALNGATRIVQRVTCVPVRGKSACSTRNANYVRTERLSLLIEDGEPPSLGILPALSLSRGDWIAGRHQVLRFNARDNAGIANATALIGNVIVGSETPTCSRAVPVSDGYAELRPCVESAGMIDIDTTQIPDGTHEIVVQIRDIAGNTTVPPAVTAHIDNTPPERIDVAVSGASGWRNHADVELNWANHPEVDRAPIAAAVYKLCPAAGGECRSGEQGGAGLTRLALSVPSPGQWTASVWLRDAAGNESSVASSVPVAFGYDPEAPKLEFEAASPADPTLIAVGASDGLSGVATGAIEISADGSGIWRELPAERTGDRIVARIDDTSLPAGAYKLRARAVDNAGNQTVLDAAIDGQPLTLTLPLRIVTRVEGGFERERTVRHTVRRHGREREVVRRVPVITQSAHVLFGESAQVAGRLIDPAGVGLPGVAMQVLATTPLAPEQLIGSVMTDPEGRFRYAAAGASNRTLRLVYPGSATTLPAEARFGLTVAATTQINADRTRLRNGQTVTFSGPVSTLPTPQGGKLIELQVRLPGRWETFQTIRSNEGGQWQARYRFRRTGGVQYYRFRARLPAEGGYPFAAGVSRVITVRVRGA
jgi:hypothetical protein